MALSSWGARLSSGGTGPSSDRTLSSRGAGLSAGGIGLSSAAGGGAARDRLRTDLRTLTAVHPAEADLAHRLFFGRDLFIGGYAKAGAAIGALAGLALKTCRAVQAMPIRAKELDLGHRRRRGGGPQLLIGKCRVAELGPRDGRIGPRRLHLRDSFWDAKFHPTAGALRGPTRLGRLTTNAVPVRAKKLDHGTAPVVGCQPAGRSFLDPTLRTSQ